MATKLWDKGFDVDSRIERFTVGRDREMDMYLAEYDVIGSMAHGKMLKSIGILSAEEEQQLQEGLKEIWENILRDEFVIEPGVEDVHSQVELLLTKKLGEVGKKSTVGVRATTRFCSICACTCATRCVKFPLWQPRFLIP